MSKSVSLKPSKSNIKKPNTNQSTNQPTNQPLNQPTNKQINQPINKQTNQTTSQPTNGSILTLVEQRVSVNETECWISLHVPGPKIMVEVGIDSQWGTHKMKPKGFPFETLFLNPCSPNKFVLRVHSVPLYSGPPSCQSFPTRPKGAAWTSSQGGLREFPLTSLWSFDRYTFYPSLGGYGGLHRL